MGNFYTNITLKGPLQDKVAGALAKMDRTAFVSPTVDGYTVIYDAECDDQDPRIISRLTGDLSRRLACPAIAFLNHDDDILWYQLYGNGELIDEYNSAPDYFDFEAKGEPSRPAGGDPDKLVQAFGISADTKALEKVLRTSSLDEDGFVFAYERHQALVGLLGMPPFGVACGFNYVSQGELPEGLTEADLRRVG
jgi:hypothetical protein